MSEAPAETTKEQAAQDAAAATGGSATLVGAGILLSRIAGLIRERALAHYFGTSLFADVFRAALRTPNVLQNLLGEGTLSASFIPVYAELLEEGREEEAGRVAGTVFALLLAIAGAFAVVGVLFAPFLVTVLLPGFEGLRRELSITAIRILFPMAGTLVLSAWALGILNSHRRFFIPYVAPVLWNGAIIATLIGLGGWAGLRDLDLLLAASWGALVGGLLQFAVQLPWVLRLTRRLDIGWNTHLEGVREAAKNAGPAILGRGVVQLSSWVDLILASLLAIGAVAALNYALTLYLLPYSLFGMSIAAAELPELSRQRGAAKEALRRRLTNGLRQIAFLVVPSVVGYLVLGDVIVAALYQTGDFGPDDTMLVYIVLAGYAVGLLASTATRLYNSSFYALRDTITPAKIAFLRVVLAAAAGYVLMFQFQEITVMGRPLGPVGLSLAAGAAAWVELVLLRRRLRARIGKFGLEGAALAKMFAAAIAAAAVGRGVVWLLPELHPIIVAALALTPYGLVYFGAAHVLGLDDALRAVKRVAGKFGV